MDFKAPAASKKTFKEPNPAISHLMKFVFNPEITEYILKVSIVFLTDNKSLRKNVESIIREGRVQKKKKKEKEKCFKTAIPLMSVLLFINSKSNSKASINSMPTWDDTGVHLSLN